MSYTCKHLRPRSTGGNDLVRGRAAAKCLLFLLPSDKSPRVLSLPLPVADAAYNFVVVVVVVVLCCCCRFLSFDVCFFGILVIQLLCVALKVFRIFGCLRGKIFRRFFGFAFRVFCDSDNHLPNFVALVRNPCCILFDGVQHGGREVWDQRRGCDEVIFFALMICVIPFCVFGCYRGCFVRRLHSLFFVLFSSSSVVELFAKSHCRLSESESYIRLSIAYFTG